MDILEGKIRNYVALRYYANKDLLWFVRGKSEVPKIWYRGQGLANPSFDLENCEYCLSHPKHVKDCERFLKGDEFDVYKDGVRMQRAMMEDFENPNIELRRVPKPANGEWWLCDYQDGKYKRVCMFKDGEWFIGEPVEPPMVGKCEPIERLFTKSQMNVLSY